MDVRTIDLEAAFSACDAALSGTRHARSRRDAGGLTMILDRIRSGNASAGAEACSLPPRSGGHVDKAEGAEGGNDLLCATCIGPGPIGWSMPVGFDMSTGPAGGYVFSSADAGASVYWAPLLPRAITRDNNLRLLSNNPAPLTAIQTSADGVRVVFESGAGAVEAVMWRLPRLALKPPCTLERSGWFMLGSHTRVQGRADVYRHLVAGTVYEDRKAWPNKWHVFSENDAHALHLILGGLAHASRDPMLAAIRDQLLLAVLNRQAEDGGFHHGEWTDLMESHYRLHCSAMHLMMDALAERRDPAVESALRAAAAFLSRQSATLSFGTWMLHDELEHTPAKMKLGPFKWVPSTAFGKTESNMLVLNSHLDATIALDRYAELTGDHQYAAQVQSARQAAAAVLSLRSAPALYGLLFWMIGLTFLPAAQATALPVWKRALKRVAREYLTPRLPDVKARFPRLVMPGGYIDRELTLRTWAHDYHAINLMDLARYLRRFDEPIVRKALLNGLEFAHRSGILGRWREMKYQKYALGFWAETLYHVCTLFPDTRYRQWLAEAMLTLEDLQMGQPPSLLGANAEAIPVDMQMPCPSPTDSRLRVANLGRQGAPEVLVINPSHEPIRLEWEMPPPAGLRWQRADSSELVRESELAARSWALAHLGN